MKKQLLIFALITSSATHAVLHTNILRSYDNNMKPVYWINQEKQLGVFGAFGASAQGRNADGTKVNDLQYLHADQNGLAMLKGSATTSEAANIAQQINVNGDDGVRGHYKVTGDFKVGANVVFSGRYRLLSDFTLGAALPVYSMSVKNVTWANQTKNVTGDDALTRSLLTDNFATNVSRLGSSLDLTDWDKSGVGDLQLFLNWDRRFLQQKDWLKEVGVHTHIGINVPTGVKKDEDKAVSLAFGNDGAFSVPFGAGLDLRFRTLFWAGVDVKFEHIFSHTKERRIMTDAAQTNLLFLQKAKARKEHGITQMFNVYLEPQLIKGLSLRVAYQHTKHAEDKLFTISDDYSSIVASKAEDLKEWTTHHMLLQLKWDRQKVNSDARIKPQISLFGQVPFNGKRSLQTSAIGMSVSFGF